VLRYDAPKEGLIDGALFVMVNGTDPEITLQIEARQEKTSPEQYYYWALSPMTTFELMASVNNVEVWHTPTPRSTGPNDSFHPHRIDGQVE
jgi:hypothetical protein